MKKKQFFLALVAKIERLILRLGKCQERGGKSSVINSDVIRKVEEWILQKRWLEDKSMAETAREIGISKELLSLYFRCIVKKSFLHWRKEMRIAEAKKLLLEERSTPLLIVAESVGIGDKSNFRKQFKEVAGCTPTEWRLKH
jgi:AraC-like DNA-binding protein